MTFNQLRNLRNKLCTGLVLGLGAVGSTRAADVTLDFSQDPTSTGQVTLFGSAQWRDTGGNPGGYLSVTDAMDSQRAAIVFGDLDNGLVVKAFNFSVDVRIGGGSATPADGFSINYVRAGDDVLDDGEGWSDIGNSGDLNLPEEGAKTGLAVGFDAYLSGGGTITDVIGLSVRVDNQLLAQYPFPVLNGALTDTTSLQTGGQNPAYVEGTSPIEDSWALLGWAKFEVNLAEDGKLTIKYKGREVTPAGGLQTTFFPSPGQLVFAGRTGGENQNHHIDNIRLVTVPAELPFFTGLSGTAAGFTFELADGGTQVATNTIAVKLNGAAVTLSSITKDGNTTRGTYNPPTPLPSGSTNSVEVTFRDTAGREVIDTRSFVVRPYATLTAADTIPSNTVDLNSPGFTARIHQLPMGRFPGDANSIRNAERHLANRYIDPATGQPYENRADLTGTTGGVFTVTGTINWNQDVNTSEAPAEIGSFTSASEPSRPDTQIPGIPGPVTNPDGTFYTDNIAGEILTYLQLQPGLYRFGVNSDDGFRVTAGKHYRDIFQENLGAYDGGKGSSDVLFDVWVEAAGIYPVRLAWWEGGGGANLEFFTLNEATGEKILVNDREVTGHVPAYKISSARSEPYVAYVSPGISETGVFPAPIVTVDIRDGNVALDDGSVALTLNGSALATSVANNGTLTTVTAPVTTPVASNSTNTLTLTYSVPGTAGTDAYTVTQAWTFVASPFTEIPAALGSPVGSGNTNAPGFNARIYQLEVALDQNGAATTQANELYWADAVLSGLAGPNMATVTNVVPIETVINLDQEGLDAGAFNPSANIPGIPGTSTAPTDNISGEFTTYVEFPAAGFYRFGVNSDDGFRVTAGENRGRYLLEVLAPTAVAGPLPAVLSARGIAGGTFGPLPAAPITADVVYATPGDACADLTNVGELAGKIALVDRGTCGFIDKARRAQAAGAIAMIIINNNPGFPFVAGGGLDDVTIPVVMISEAAGTALKSNLTGLRMSLGAETAPVLGEFNNGRGAAGSLFDGTLFTVRVPQAGVYPLRLLWMEGNGGGNVEWYTVTPEGEGILVNDRSNPRALKAYRSRTSVSLPTVSVELSQDKQNITVTFTGTLQSATEVNGPYTDVAGASPQSFPVTGNAKRFFRSSQ